MCTEKDKSLQFRLNRFDAQIRIEFDLIGHRMTWLMMSQSFFFAAFALSVTCKEPRILLIVKWLQYLIPIIGAVSTVTVGIAIQAAHRVLERLKPDRERLEAEAVSAGYEKLGVDIESQEHRDGNLPSSVLPWILTSVWTALLIVNLCSL